MAELSSVGQFPMTFLVIVYIFHEEKNGLKTFWKNPPTPEFCVQRNLIFLMLLLQKDYLGDKVK